MPGLLFRQADNLGPALHQAVVGERLGGAFFAFAQGAEAVAQFPGGLGLAAEFADKLGSGTLGRGRTAWRSVFEHLADVRSWGPQDRLTAEAVEDWRERLKFAPDTSIRFEIEFWYRNDEARRLPGK